MKTSENNFSNATKFPDITDWNAINWHDINKYVDKLQKRIVHAESEYHANR